MPINTNSLSFNAYIQQIASMAVVTASEVSGVWQFVDAPLQVIVPQMLNYAELRISRDIDTLSSQSSNNYTLVSGQNVLSIPVDDFFTIQTLEITQTTTQGVVNSQPVLPVSKEFIQNCYGGLSSAGTPQYFAMYGDSFGSEQDSFTNILLGPPPNFAYTLRVTGTCRQPSLFKNAVSGIADTEYTYISEFYPDMLMLASMIYISMFQRNFGVVSDTPESGMTYEKQYQALRLGAIAEENLRKLQGSAWSAYSTPTSATPTR
jgi:hypothetical protein